MDKPYNKLFYQLKCPECFLITNFEDGECDIVQTGENKTVTAKCPFCYSKITATNPTELKW